MATSMQMDVFWEAEPWLFITLTLNQDYIHSATTQKTSTEDYKAQTAQFLETQQKTQRKIHQFKHGALMNPELCCTLQN